MGIEWWLVPVIAGVIGIIAGWLGNYWGKRAEERQWLRNEKLKVYPEFVGMMDFGELDFAALTLVLHKVHLIGSHQVYQDSVDVWTFSTKLAAARDDNGDDLDDAAFEEAVVLNRINKALVLIVEHLIYQMRCDLDRRTKREYKEFAKQYPRPNPDDY